jgi:glycosyltransferase involved in cell wall biosynthesis
MSYRGFGRRPAAETPIRLPATGCPSSGSKKEFLKPQRVIPVWLARASRVTAMGAGNSPTGRIALIGNYLPRQCGIATFTTHLCEAIVAQQGTDACFAIPVNDRPTGYAYPDRVRFELSERDLTSYQRAADFLNMSGVDVVCLQHEYGIFGGQSGSHILALLRELRMPTVTTLHTVLESPDAGQRQVLEELATLSDRLVVMSERAVEFLTGVYDVPRARIELIPHGIPDVPFVDPNFYKDQFGVQGKIVLLTFGLLSPNKGIEHVLDALPSVLAYYPNLVYIVLGATHPHVKAHDGESYRLSLERRAKSHGVESHVVFINRFVSQQELVECIGAADLYLTPYLNPAQIVSGTLAYTLGAGKVVISTPYWYAEELLGEERGVLVPFADPNAIASQVIDLLGRDADRHAMRKRAYLFGRDMIWPTVARRYEELFAAVREARAIHPRPVFEATTLEARTALPDLKLDHLLAMTDDTGLLQHATYTVPNYDEGYTTDDNARALMLAVLLEQGFGSRSIGTRYLAFLWHAFDLETRRFRNVMAYDRRWLDAVGSEDAHGRALRALGLVLGRSEQSGLRGVASRLFEQALPTILNCASPRAWADALLGIHAYLRRYSGDRTARRIEATLADRLMALYTRYSTADWQWFEEVLSYDNALLPQALLTASTDLERADMRRAALTALGWLMDVQRAGETHLVPIGSNGFYRRGGARARFDQQPIEAQATVSACLYAYEATRDGRWHDEAVRAFEWFLGRNDLGLSLYDASTGGCRDGLHADRVSQNEGGESTVAFLLALAEMTLAEHILEPAHAQTVSPALDTSVMGAEPRAHVMRSWPTDTAAASSSATGTIPS